MRFSAKSRYGLKVMYALAKNYGNDIMSTTEISEKAGVKLPFLEKVIAKLKKGGFIVATRGVNGGYQLAYPPKYISIAQILATLEEYLFSSDCINGKCKNKNCPNKEVFGTIYDTITEVLGKLTLEAVINDTRSVYEKNLFR